MSLEIIRMGLLFDVVNPIQLPTDSLAFFFDGQDPRGNGVAPLNGSSISTWFDKSRNRINVSQGTGSQQATYQTNIINGRSAMLFTSASSRFYQRAAVRVFDNINNYSIYAVVRPVNIATTNVIIEGGNGNATGLYILSQINGPIRMVQRSPYSTSGGDSVVSANNAITANNNFFLRYIRNGVTGNQTVTSSNGITANLSSLTQPALPATDMLFSVGVNGGGMTGSYFTGYIGAIFGYTKILSALEEAVLFNYIFQRWGIIA